jgi:hypothetical protein
MGDWKEKSSLHPFEEKNSRAFAHKIDLTLVYLHYARRSEMPHGKWIQSRNCQASSEKQSEKKGGAFLIPILYPERREEDGELRGGRGTQTKAQSRNLLPFLLLKLKGATGGEKKKKREK